MTDGECENDLLQRMNEWYRELGALKCLLSNRRLDLNAKSLCQRN